MIRTTSIDRVNRIATDSRALCGAVQRIGESLTGPGRRLDPVEAMAADIGEIAGAGHGVDEAALRCRGWTLAEIAQHLAPALALVQHRDAVPA